jgi:MFS transporter, CP family, cyanate transporter
MREFWVAAGLLWLAGVGLRLTILAVPPVIALMQADLGLSGTQVGILSGLPVIVFGIAALPGSLLIARVGALAALVTGLLIGGVASGLRGALLNVWALYAFTIVMSAGITVMQTALPPLVRAWMPQRVSFGTALYTNGLLVGETLPVMLMLPLVFPLVQDSWRGGLAVWGIPLIVIALLTVALAPRSQAVATDGAIAERPQWWPNWRDKFIWQGALLIAGANSIYFASNAFLPGYLTEAGRPDLISAALTALNFGQLPASFLLLAAPTWFERRAWPFVLSGIGQLVCLAGIVMTASAWTVAFAGVLGFIGAVILTLGFALPPLLAPAHDVARVTAAMLTISYTEALIVSVLSGAAWDIGGSAHFAFMTMAVAALPLLCVPFAVRFHQTRDG